MIPLSLFPKINASLNGLSALFLLLGFIFVKNKNILFHRISMGLASLTSVLFLACYLYYHAYAGHVKFSGMGWVRPVYFSILLSHTILAIVILPMVLRTLYFALTQKFDRHAKIARWTWPLWMYVSVTGVIIYFMVYVLYGAQALA